MKSLTVVIGSKGLPVVIGGIIYSDEALFKDVSAKLDKAWNDSSYELLLPVQGGVHRIRAGTLLSYSWCDLELEIEHLTAYSIFNQRRNRLIKEACDEEDEKERPRTGFSAGDTPGK